MSETTEKPEALAFRAPAYYEEWASVEVPADADLSALIQDSPAVYVDGRLYVDVPQEALDNTLADTDLRPMQGADIRAKFDRIVAAGAPLSDGRTAQIDDGSLLKLQGAALMASLGANPDGEVWRLTDNSSLPLTAAQVVPFAAYCAGYWRALFAHRNTLLDAAKTDTVDVDAPWPVPPPFNVSA